MFQLSWTDYCRQFPPLLGRLWRAYSRCLLAVYFEHVQAVSWHTMGWLVPALPEQTMAGMFLLSLRRLWCSCSSVPGHTMAGIFQLSLGRLWCSCSSCPWTDYGRQNLAVSGQTMCSCSSVPGQTMAGMF